MVQQFYFLTVCIVVVALLAHVATANDGGSSASANANDCLKDFRSEYAKSRERKKSGCKWKVGNRDLASGPGVSGSGLRPGANVVGIGIFRLGTGNRDLHLYTIWGLRSHFRYFYFLILKFSRKSTLKN
jgi:hypothetical protein